ncbi:MAG: YihY/virulence factor BrkB family protein [Verrucomicrobiales bacterium]
MRRLGAILKISFVRFFTVSGSDHAAAFAFYAFFSLFPVVLLLVSFADLFFDRQAAVESIINSMKDYLPMDDSHRESLSKSFEAVVKNPAPARFVGILSLLWAGVRFFKSLVHVHNLIWHCRELPWWHTPVKSATMLATLASALVLGIGAPVMLHAIHGLPFLQSERLDTLFDFGESMVPPLVLFYGLFLFYKVSPQTAVSSRDVWLPALIAATLLTLSRKALILLVQMTINQIDVYDSIGVFIAALWSMYLSGQIIIWCGCLGAAIHETRPANPDPDSVI